jgi:hypothetical protein
MKHQEDQEQEILDSQMDQTGIQARAREFIGTEQAGTNCKVILIQPDDLEVVWDEVVPLIDAALKYSEGEVISEDLVKPLKTGKMQLWVAMFEGSVIAAMITEIVVYPRKRVLRVITIAGKDGRGMGKWYGFLPLVEGFALNNNCSSLEAWTRKGMAKKLKDWEHKYMVITKDLKSRMQ